MMERIELKYAANRTINSLTVVLVLFAGCIGIASQGWAIGWPYLIITCVGAILFALILIAQLKNLFTKKPPIVLSDEGIQINNVFKDSQANSSTSIIGSYVSNQFIPFSDIHEIRLNEIECNWLQKILFGNLEMVINRCVNPVSRTETATEEDKLDDAELTVDIKGLIVKPAEVFALAGEYMYVYYDKGYEPEAKEAIAPILKRVKSYSFLKAITKSFIFKILVVGGLCLATYVGYEWIHRKDIQPVEHISQIGESCYDDNRYVKDYNALWKLQFLKAVSDTCIIKYKNIFQFYEICLGEDHTERILGKDYIQERNANRAEEEEVEKVMRDILRYAIPNDDPHHYDKSGIRDFEDYLDQGRLNDLEPDSILSFANRIAHVAKLTEAEVRQLKISADRRAKVQEEYIKEMASHHRSIEFNEKINDLLTIIGIIGVLVICALQLYEEFAWLKNDQYVDFYRSEYHKKKESGNS